MACLKPFTKVQICLCFVLVLFQNCFVGTFVLRISLVSAFPQFCRSCRSHSGQNLLFKGNCYVNRRCLRILLALGNANEAVSRARVELNSKSTECQRLPVAFMNIRTLRIQRKWKRLKRTKVPLDWVEKNFSEQLKKDVSYVTPGLWIISSITSLADHYTIGLSASTLAPLQRVMHAVVRLACDLKPHDHVSASIRVLHWLPIKQRIDSEVCFLVHQTINGRAPSYLLDLIAPSVKFFDVQHSVLRSSWSCSTIIAS